MISNTDSILIIYSIEHMLVKVYCEWECRVSRAVRQRGTMSATTSGGGAGEKKGEAMPRKGGAFPHGRRRSRGRAEGVVGRRVRQRGTMSATTGGGGRRGEKGRGDAPER